MEMCCVHVTTNNRYKFDFDSITKDEWLPLCGNSLVLREVEPVSDFLNNPDGWRLWGKIIVMGLSRNNAFEMVERVLFVQ